MLQCACRVYHQNGPSVNSSTLFLASLKAMNLLEHHTIIPDGYNINQWVDVSWLCQVFTKPRPVSDVIASAAIGKTSYKGVTYFTRVRDVMGLLEPGVKGVNHSKSISSSTPIHLLTLNAWTDISQDRIVVLLTVTIVEWTMCHEVLLLLFRGLCHSKLNSIYYDAMSEWPCEKKASNVCIRIWTSLTSDTGCIDVPALPIMQQ